MPFRFRPALESLDGRIVPSTTGTSPPDGGGATAATTDGDTQPTTTPVVQDDGLTALVQDGVVYIGFYNDSGEWVVVPLMNADGTSVDIGTGTISDSNAWQKTEVEVYGFDQQTGQVTVVSTELVAEPGQTPPGQGPGGVLEQPVIPPKNQNPQPNPAPPRLDLIPNPISRLTPEQQREYNDLKRELDGLLKRQKDLGNQMRDQVERIRLLRAQLAAMDQHFQNLWEQYMVLANKQLAGTATPDELRQMNDIAGRMNDVIQQRNAKLAELNQAIQDYDRMARDLGDLRNQIAVTKGKLWTLIEPGLPPIQRQ